jgi:hypothetical protein
MAEERSDPGGQGGFLPPEPGGREPDLGGGGPASGPPQVQQDWQPPAHAAPQQQQSWQQPPPGWQQQWQQSPPQQWGHPQPQQAVPDNGPAVAGFTLSVVSGSLLLVSVGFSSLISVVCAGLGIFYSRRGRSRVDRGETPKHRSLAQAGFIVGIVSLILAVLATAFWTFFLVAYATDDEFRRDFNEDNQFNGTESAITIGALAARSLWALVA